MAIIQSEAIKKAVIEGYKHICCNIDSDVVCALGNCKPQNEVEAFALNTMLKNAVLAAEHNIPACQDTGMSVVFLEIGQEVQIVGDYLEDAINSGVREAYKGFRKSVLSPIARKNTNDNSPAIIHTSIVKGRNIKISIMAKGFGSENMSKVYMLTPADGIEGIKAKVIQTVKEAGGCPCPPVIVGVGIGGDLEKCALMSKHALFRKIGSKNPFDSLDILEKELLDRLNNLGVGAQGFGGATTALAVFVETYPTHIAGLPVAITIQCHASRHIEMVLEGV
jgi:fumarate hydratase subunit alpha